MVVAEASFASATLSGSRGGAAATGTFFAAGASLAAAVACAFRPSNSGKARHSTKPRRAAPATAPPIASQRIHGREHRASIDLGRRLAHERAVDDGFLARIGAEQCTVRNDIDDARHAARKAVELALRPGREEVARCAGDARAVAEVGERLVLPERLEVVAAGDALRELAQILPRQDFAQFRLADQDDLQQLLRRGLEIREQAHLLEHVGVEVLRLIHHQHNAPAAAVSVEQEVREEVNERLDAALGTGRHLHVQLVADGEEEFRGRDARVQDQRDVTVRRELLQEAAEHGRLAGADLARQLDEAAGLADAVGEMSECLGVALAEIEVSRIRRDRERLFVQPEEARIHDEGVDPIGNWAFMMPPPGMDWQRKAGNGVQLFT
jgi:hypothetical protein